MKKFISFALILLLSIPILCYTDIQDEGGRLKADTTPRTLKFTTPTTVLTVINDGSAALHINFRGAVDTDLSRMPSAFTINSSESMSWSFNLGNRLRGLDQIGYATSAGTAYFRWHSVSF